MSLLLKRMSDVNDAGFNHCTPLHLAAEGGHLEVVELLLSKKAETEKRMSFGDTALHLAVRNGHVLCVKALVRGKCNIDALDRDGEWPSATAQKERLRGKAGPPDPRSTRPTERPAARGRVGR